MEEGSTSSCARALLAGEQHLMRRIRACHLKEVVASYAKTQGLAS